MSLKRSVLAMALATATLAPGMFSTLLLAQETQLIPAGQAVPIPSADALPPVLMDQATVFSGQTNQRVELELTGLAALTAGAESETVVLLINPQGETTRVVADSAGKVVFDATPGLHAAFVLSRSGHAAVPFVVRQSENAASGDAPASIKVPAFDLSVGAVNRAANSFLPPFADKTWAESLNRPLIESGKVIPTQLYRVRLSADGTMEGQLFPLTVPEVFAKKVGGTNVLIHQNGKLIARSIADPQGRFYVKDLQPGVYGLVAAGTVGYAAFAFEAVVGQADPGLSASVSNGSQTLVSFLKSLTAAETLIAAVSEGSVLPVTPIPPGLIPGEVFGGELVELEACETCGEVVEEGCDACGGCGAPSCGGGGGFVGGGGGGGGAGFGGAGLLPLAAMIPLLFLDDDDDPTPIPMTVSAP